MDKGETGRGIKETPKSMCQNPILISELDSCTIASSHHNIEPIHCAHWKRHLLHHADMD